MRFRAGLVALSVALASCTPATEDESASASADEALTAAKLVGHRWAGDEASSFRWLEITNEGSGLAYRAGRRAPFRNEAGTVLLDGTGNGVTFVRGHVKERFVGTMRGDALALKGVKAKHALVRLADPTPAAIDAKPPFPVVTAVRGSDGKVYATGRAMEQSVPATPFASFDPVTGTWTELLPVPFFTHFPATVAGADGRIYLLGGYDDSFMRNMSGAFSVVMAYDIEKGTWIEMPPLPEARANLGAAVCPDGRIVVVGGWRSNGLGMGPMMTYFRKPILYDPRTGVSTFGADAGRAVHDMGVASSPSGLVYYAGGTDKGSGEGHSPSETSSSPYVLAYDCRTDRWDTTIPTMPSGRANPTAFVDERGNLFVVGGEEGGGGYPKRWATSTHRFDPVTRTWSTTDTIVRGRAPTVLPGPGHAWVFGEKGFVPFVLPGGAP